MDSHYVELVKKTILVLDTFKSDKQSLNHFIDDVSRELQNMDVMQRTFIIEVVTGCIEHKKLLDIVVDGFYCINQKCLSRKTRNLFVVICYLTTFALDELGIQNFNNIIKTFGIKKMFTFLTFYFLNLTSWIQDEWNSVFDEAFVQDHLINPLLKWRPEIDTLLKRLENQIYHESHLIKRPRKVTVPEEFCLSKRQLRPLSEPTEQELISKKKKCRPVRVPKTTYRSPKELQILEQMKEQNHQKNLNLLHESNTKQFRCANIELPKKTMVDFERDFYSKLQFKTLGPPPTNKVGSCAVKLNNAALLRKEALFDHQLEQEIQRQELLVQGGGEPSGFFQWQKKMLDSDPHTKMSLIERKRLQEQIRSQRACIAREKKIERNQKLAQQNREETLQWMQKRAEKQLKEEKEMKELVHQVAEIHKKSKMAREKSKKLKHSIAKEVTEKNEQLYRQAEEDEERRRWKRHQIIQEIHTMESCRRSRHVQFDETEIAGHELLHEMSLAELKERLAMMKAMQQVEEEERRNHILEEKERKKQLFTERLENLELQSKAVEKAAAIRREEKKTHDGFMKKMLAQDETVLALQKELEEAKQECYKLKLSNRKARSHSASASQKLSLACLKKKSWDEMGQDLTRFVQDNFDGIC